MPRMVKPVLEGDDDWQARSDANTLMDAEKIRSDGPRHEKAKKHVRKNIFPHAARVMTGGKKGKSARFTARAKLGADE